MYRQTDSFRKTLKTKIRSEFNHLSVIAFDELNVVRISKELKETYKRLLEFNREQYRAIVREAHEYALLFLSVDKDKINEDDYVDYVLSTYNPVTGYLYEKEAERKRLRQGEEMATALTYLDRQRYQSAIQKSANLWFTQSGQYAIDLEDYTVLETWKKHDVKKVQWIAEDDNKTCSVCKKRDGQIYDIDKVPTKTHYNCRCTVVPYVVDIDS